MKLFIILINVAFLIKVLFEFVRYLNIFYEIQFKILSLYNIYMCIFKRICNFNAFFTFLYDLNSCPFWFRLRYYTYYILRRIIKHILYEIHYIFQQNILLLYFLPSIWLYIKSIYKINIGCYSQCVPIFFRYLILWGLYDQRPPCQRSTYPGWTL